MASKRPVIYLHVGTMKSGTTYLQKLMTVNAPALLEAGYLFPVDTDGWGTQVRAMRDVLDRYDDADGRSRVEGAWERLTERMQSHDGIASIFSMELLSFTGRRGAGRVVGSLAGAEVHLILTVRDAAGTIPAQWQTATRSGHTGSWREFAEQVMADPPERGSAGYRIFHRAQNVPGILDAWLPFVPAPRFHVVTVPPVSAPRQLLWERFASVLGVDAAVCDRPPPTSNESIGAASAELMRRLNAELGEIERSDYRQTLTSTLAAKILPERAGLERKAQANRPLREFAARANAATREAVVAAGVDVVGDLDDLPTRPSAPPADGPDDLTGPTREELLDAAGFAIPRMREVVSKRARKLRKRDVEVADALAALPESSAPGTNPRWAAAADPTGAAVGELAEVVRVAIELQRRLRSAPSRALAGRS